MENQDKIDFEKDENARILRDSIGWLEVLDDLKERLPELDKDYKLEEREDSEKEFPRSEELLVNKIRSGEAPVRELMNRFVALVELACSESQIERLRRVADEELIPAVKGSKEDVDVEGTMKFMERAIEYAERYVADLRREEGRMGRMIEGE